MVTACYLQPGVHKCFLSLTDQSPGPGQFDIPHSLALDHHSNHLYICDRENARIQVYTTDGKFLRIIFHKEFGSSLYAVTFNKAYGKYNHGKYLCNYDMHWQEKILTCSAPGLKIACSAENALKSLSSAVMTGRYFNPQCSK